MALSQHRLPPTMKISMGIRRPGQAPPFRGIPDGSMEFQLLLELVGDAGHSYTRIVDEGNIYRTNLIVNSLVGV